MPNPYVNKIVQSNGTTLIDISDTTAVAADVTQGKFFYLATGEKVEGTGSGGGGGLVFETGTYNPSADTAGEKILFANTHSEAPVFVHMVDATGTADTTSNTNMEFMWYDFYKLYGIGMPWSASAFRYATAFYIYRATNASALTYGAVNCTYNSDIQEASGINLPRFWVDELGFTPNSASTSRYWRAGRTYKWYAVWRDT